MALFVWYNTKTRGVAVAIFSFRFHVLYFPVGYQLTISYLTKHENQIVFPYLLSAVKKKTSQKKKQKKKQSSLQIKVDYDIYFVYKVSKVTLH